jgi:hypothetical protein
MPNPFLKRLVARKLTLGFVPDTEQRRWRAVARRKYQLTRDQKRRVMQRPEIAANSANLVWRNDLRRMRTIRAILSFEWALRAFLSHVYSGLLFAQKVSLGLRRRGVELPAYV